MFINSTTDDSVDTTTSSSSSSNGDQQQQKQKSTTLDELNINNNITDDDHVNYNDTTTTSTEQQEHRIITPIVLCILITETSERLAYFGFRAILVFYFHNELYYTETQSIANYAYTTAIAYYTPLVGSIIADGYLGLYNTIYYFSLLYIIGLAILSYAASISIVNSTTTSSLLVDDTNFTSNNSTSNVTTTTTTTIDNDDDSSSLLLMKRTLSFIGLFFVCVGTGGIKPCVSAFGANQVPRQQQPEVQQQQQQPEVQQVPEEINKNTNDTTNTNTNTNSANTTTNTNSTNTIQEDTNVRKFFSYFYFCINFGAVSAIAIIPIVRVQIGYSVAFFIPFICMIVAILLFTSQKNNYIHIIPNNNTNNNGSSSRSCGSSNLLITLNIVRILIIENIKNFFYMYCYRYCYWCCQYFGCSNNQQHIPIPLSTDEDNDSKSFNNSNSHITKSNSHNVPNDTDTDVDDDDTDAISLGTIKKYNLINIQQNYSIELYNDAKQIIHVLPILMMYPIYWCLYDQQGSVWTLQASRMTLPYNISPEQLLLVNPILIMIFLPLFGQLNICQMTRMSWGMILTIISFIISGILEMFIQQTTTTINSIDSNSNSNVEMSSINVFWQIPQITILAVGEIFLSVTGLEFAYSSSPIHLRALLLGIYLATSAVGDTIGGILYSTIFVTINRSNAMFICSFLLFCNLQLFYYISKHYTHATTNNNSTDVTPNNNNNNNNNEHITALGDGTVRCYHEDQFHYPDQSNPGIRILRHRYNDCYDSNDAVNNHGEVELTSNNRAVLT